MPYFRSLLLSLVVSVLIPHFSAHAQRGQLIEGLFRTIAEAQLERETRKRLEAERAATQTPPLDRTRSELNLPPGLFPGNQPPGNRPGSINVRSREAALFAQDLVNFSAGIDPLVEDLRSGATRNPAIRALLPEAYQVSADTRALIRRCDGLASLQPVVASYSDLDARWRQLSFSLRSLDGLSDRCTTSIRSCDRLVGSMAKQLRIQPQFDRHQLHDLMIVAASYMQTLMDDLQLAAIPRQQVAQLTHDCRLLRQRLLGEADHVHDMSYEDVVTRFTDFVARWRPFAEQVYAVNDPYLHRRLNRISECGDQTYALLWMPPPYNARTLTATAHRLEQGCAQLLDQLTFRTLASLSRQDQLRVFESSRNMHQRCREFEEATTRGVSRRDLQQLFAGIDRDWVSLRTTYAQLPAINQAALADVDHQCGQLRRALGVSSAVGPTIDRNRLLQVAAALEGAAEYLDADLQRYERYLQPSSFRKSIIEASREFHHHAEELHSELSRRTDLRKLQREAEHMLDGWTQLTKDLDHIEAHGLTERRAASLRRWHQEAAPLVAQAAAALLER